MKKLTQYINKALHLFEVMRIKTKEKVVYLTFDDGPEEGITEFVLDELTKYDFKATFFCRGDNAVRSPVLLERIKSEGHAVGNHTYSHIKGFDTPSGHYVEDVNRANEVLKTHLFRPPWGAVTLSQFLKLKRHYKIIYWSLMSGDTEGDKFVPEKAFNKLKNKTQKGDVVLFHFCKKHENETKQILPVYLQWLNDNGYISRAIEQKIN